MANEEKMRERVPDNTKSLKVNVNDEMRQSFIAYAMAVNVSRAIPDVRDGLKPVHRRIPTFSVNTTLTATRRCTTLWCVSRRTSR